MWKKAYLLLAISALVNAAQASIIGKDDRQQVRKRSSISDTIGVVYSSFAGSPYSKCTGTSIGNDYVITAAHCVFDFKSGKLANDIAFVPALIKSRAVYDDRYFAKEVHILKGFQKRNGSIPSLHDIALLKVKNEDLPSLSEEFGYRDVSRFSYQRMRGDFYSYPADKPDAHSLWKENSCLNVLHNSGVIASRCDTYPGASGGALLDSYNRVIAVNSAERDNANLFSPITAQIAQAIQKIQTGGKASEFAFYQPKVSPYYSVHLRNNCSKEIKVAIFYSKDSSENRIPEGYFHVKTGEVVHNVIKTQNPILGLYAQDLTGSLEWWGRDFRYESSNKVINFYEEDLPPIWKDKTFSFNCD